MTQNSTPKYYAETSNLLGITPSDFSEWNSVAQTLVHAVEVLIADQRIASLFNGNPPLSNRRALASPSDAFNGSTPPHLAFPIRPSKKKRQRDDSDEISSISAKFSRLDNSSRPTSSGSLDGGGGGDSMDLSSSPVPEVKLRRIASPILRSGSGTNCGEFSVFRDYGRSQVEAVLHEMNCAISTSPSMLLPRTGNFSTNVSTLLTWLERASTSWSRVISLDSNSPPYVVESLPLDLRSVAVETGRNARKWLLMLFSFMLEVVGEELLRIFGTANSMTFSVGFKQSSLPKPSHDDEAISNIQAKLHAIFRLLSEFVSSIRAREKSVEVEVSPGEYQTILQRCFMLSAFQLHLSSNDLLGLSKSLKISKSKIAENFEFSCGYLSDLTVLIDTLKVLRGTKLHHMHQHPEEESANQLLCQNVLEMSLGMLEYVSVNPHMLWLSTSVKFVYLALELLVALQKRQDPQSSLSRSAVLEDLEYMRRVVQATED